MIHRKQKQSILIVDDSEFERTILQNMLSDLDITMLSASSGEEALVILAEKEVALVLLDVNMKGITGLETASRMRQSKTLAQLPIIFITGSEISKDQIGEGYDIGAVDYLLKPVDPVWLKSKVRVFCQLNEQRTIIRDQLKEIRNNNNVLKQQLEEANNKKEKTTSQPNELIHLDKLKNLNYRESNNYYQIAARVKLKSAPVTTSFIPAHVNNQHLIFFILGGFIKDHKTSFVQMLLEKFVQGYFLGCKEQTFHEKSLYEAFDLV